MRILHFSREYFVVVFMPRSPVGGTHEGGLAYGLKTLFVLKMFKNKKSSLLVMPVLIHFSLSRKR